MLGQRCCKVLVILLVLLAARARAQGGDSFTWTGNRGQQEGISAEFAQVVENAPAAGQPSEDASEDCVKVRLTGRMTLEERDARPGETFVVRMEASDSSRYAADSGILVLPQDPRARVTKLRRGQPETFAFDEVKIFGEGTYVLEISQEAQQEADPQIHADPVRYQASIAVTREEGKGLSAQVLTETGSGPADGMEFVCHAVTAPLILENTAVGAGPEETDLCGFHIRLEDPSITGVFAVERALAPGKQETLSVTGGEARVRLQAGDTLEIRGIPVGTAYAVTEDASSAGRFTRVLPEGDTGVITKAGARARFVNLRTGSLRVKREVVSGYLPDRARRSRMTVLLKEDGEPAQVSGTYGEMTFTKGKAELVLGDGEARTAEGLPQGLAVELEAQDGTAGPFGILSGEALELTFRTSREGGTLRVINEVVTSAEDGEAGTFAYILRLASPGDLEGMVTVRKSGEDAPSILEWTDNAVRFSLKRDQQADLSGLPSELNYELEQVSPDIYEVTCGGIRARTVQVEIPAQGQTPQQGNEVRFVSKRREGSLSVSLQVDSPLSGDRDTLWRCFLSLSDPSVSGSYGDVTFERGESLLELKHGQTLTAENLPQGVGYALKMEQSGAFVTASRGAMTGEIGEGTQSVQLEAARRRGTLEILHRNLVASIASNPLTCRVELVLPEGCSLEAGPYGTLSFDEQGKSQTFQLVGNAEVYIEDLPAGTLYRVTGAPATDTQTVAGVGEAGTVPPDEVSLVTLFSANANAGSLQFLLEVDNPLERDRQKESSCLLHLKFEGMESGWVTLVRYPQKGYIKSETAVVNGGTCTFAVRRGEPVRVEGLEEGTGYQVTGADMEGFDVYCLQNAGVLGEHGDSVLLTARRQLRTLGASVSVRTLPGKEAGDQARPFELLLLPEDGEQESFPVTLTRRRGEVVLSISELDVKAQGSTFALRHGESAEISGIPRERNCRITASGTEEFTAEIVEDGEEGSTRMTFVRKTGALRLSRRIISPLEEDRNGSAEIRVVLGDTEITGILGGVRFEKGEAVFDMEAGTPILLSGLPRGSTYTVSETERQGVSVDISGGNGQVSQDIGEVQLTELRESGNLEIRTRMLSRTPSDLGRTLIYDMQLDREISGEYSGIVFLRGRGAFSLTAGESLSLSGIPAGVGYTVSQRILDGLDVLPEGGSVSGIIKAGENSRAEFVTSRRESTLGVGLKVSSPSQEDAEREFAFEIALSGPDGRGAEWVEGTYPLSTGDSVEFVRGRAQLQLRSGVTVLIWGLPEGLSYRVEAQPPENFLLRGSRPEGTLSAGVSTSSWTAERKTGSLRITRQVISARTADRQERKTLTVTLEDTGISGRLGEMTFEQGVATVRLCDAETVTAKGLPAGCGYQVTAQPGEGISLTGESGRIAEGTMCEAVLTEHRTGEIWIHCRVKVACGEAEEERKQPFEVQILAMKDDRGEPLSGQYDLVTPDGASRTFRISSGVSEVIRLRHGESVRLTGLPAGTSYRMVSRSVAGYRTDAEPKQALQGEIPEGTPVEVAYTHFFEGTGDLQVTNRVRSNEINPQMEFSFEIKLTDPEGSPVSGTFGEKAFVNGTYRFYLRSGESITFRGLPARARYAVRETGAMGYTVIPGQGYSGAILAGASGDLMAVCDFVNERRSLGGVQVHSTFRGDSLGEEEAFDYVCSFFSGLGEEEKNAVFGGVQLEDGQASFRLGNGESWEITGIPAGVAYRVFQEGEDSPETVTSWVNAEGIVRGSEVSLQGGKIHPDNQVEIIQTRNAPGSLTLTSQVRGNAADPVRNFLVRISVPGLADGTYGDVTFAGGVGTVELSHGESAGMTGIPAGSCFTVFEDPEDSEDYEVSFRTEGTEGISSGQILENEAVCVTVTHTRERFGGILVGKQTEGNDGDYRKWFGVRVDLSQPLSGPYGDVIFENGQSVDLVVPPAQTGEDTDFGEGYVPVCPDQALLVNGLPAGIRYTVTEADCFGEYDSQKTEAPSGTVEGIFEEQAAQRLSGQARDSAVQALSNTENVALLINARNRTSTLEISRVLEGFEDGNREYTAVLSLSGERGKPLEGTFGGVSFTQGQAQVRLEPGDTLRIGNLPMGTEFFVEETTKDLSGLSEAEYALYRGERGENSEQIKWVQEALQGRGIQGNLHAERQRVEIISRVLPGVLSVRTEADDSGDGAERAFDYGVLLRDREGQPMTVSVETLKRKEGQEALPGERISFCEGQGWLRGVTAGEEVLLCLPAGTRYLVKEDAEASGDAVRVEQAQGVIRAGEICRCVIRSARSAAGDLVIVNTVTGNAASQEDEFVFQLEIRREDGSLLDGMFSGVLFEDGAGTFALKGGEMIRIDAIPHGSRFTLTQTQDRGYVHAPQISGVLLGTQSGDQARVVEVVNTRDTWGGILLNGQGLEPGCAVRYEVRLGDSSLNGRFGQMDFDGGRAQVTLRREAATATATGLPNGLPYEIREVSREGDASMAADRELFRGTVRGTGEEDRVDGTNRHTVNFVKVTGELLVSLYEEGNALPEGRAHEVRIRLTGPDGLTPDPGTLAFAFTGGQGQIQETDGELLCFLRHGESVCISGLPAGTRFEIAGETALVQTWTDGEPSGEGTVENGRMAAVSLRVVPDLRGGIRISKETEGGDPDEQSWFAFRIELGDKTLNGNYGDVTFVNGVSAGPAVLRPEVDLDEEGNSLYDAVTEGRKQVPSGYVVVRRGHPLNVRGLAEGLSYQVTEADMSAVYSGVSAWTEKGEQFGKTVTGTIEGTAEPEGIAPGNRILYTNTRNAAGTLVMGMRVEGNEPGNGGGFAYEIEIRDALGQPLEGEHDGLHFVDGKAGFSLHSGGAKTRARVLTGLPAGASFRIRQVSIPEGYIFDSYETGNGSGQRGRSGDMAGGVTGRISAGKEQVVFVNRAQFGSLTLEKTFGEGSVYEERQMPAGLREATWITVTGPSFPEGLRIPYAYMSGGRYELEGVIPGTYTVAEQVEPAEVYAPYVRKTKYLLLTGTGTVLMSAEEGLELVLGAQSTCRVRIEDRYLYSGDLEVCAMWKNGIDREVTDLFVNLYRVLEEGNPVRLNAAPLRISRTDEGWQPLTVPGLPGMELLSGKPYTYFLRECGYVENGVTVMEEQEIMERFTPVMTSGGQECESVEVAIGGVTRAEMVNEYTTEVSGELLWMGDTGESRPGSVCIELLKNGITFDTCEVSPGDDGEWKWTFRNVPVFDAAQNALIDYTFVEREEELDNYAVTYPSASMDGAAFARPGEVIVNTYVKPEEVLPDHSGGRPDGEGYLYEFRFSVVWSDVSGSNKPELVLCDSTGRELHVWKCVPGRNETFSKWFKDPVTGYYVTERNHEGYTVIYDNSEAMIYRESDREIRDRAFNAGTVSNSPIPATGEGTGALRWTGVLALAISGLILMGRAGRKRS